MAGLERFYGREDLADMDVVIVEAEIDGARSSRRKRARGEELVLPGHRVVVCAASEVLDAQVSVLLMLDDISFKSACSIMQMAAEGNSLPGDDICCTVMLSQILNWPAATSDNKRQRVNVEVPAGQLELGRLLLRCMYQQQPDLSGTEQAILVQLLVLADRYAVPAAVAAVGRAFKDCSASDFQWKAVCGAYSLPATCADNAAFADVYKAAADALQHALSDLELVFADAKKRQLLVELPHAALVQLLRDERTRVASENTAAHAVLEWADDNDASTEQMQQLVRAWLTGNAAKASPC
jgi:hypothetical protein